MLVALPPEFWPAPAVEPSGRIEQSLQLARRLRPKSIAVSKRGPEAKKPKGYVDGVTARAHLATARAMAETKLTR